MALLSHKPPLAFRPARRIRTTRARYTKPVPTRRKAPTSSGRCWWPRSVALLCGNHAQHSVSIDVIFTPIDLAMPPALRESYRKAQLQYADNLRHKIAELEATYDRALAVRAPRPTTPPSDKHPAGDLPGSGRCAICVPERRRC